MSRVVAVAFSLSLFLVGCQKGGMGAAVEPQTEDQKTLYALGLWAAGKMQVFNVKPDEIPYVVQGLRDGLTQGKKPLVEMSKYGPKLNELSMARGKARTEEEHKAAAAVIDAASKEPGAEKLTSGMVFRSLKEGTGPNPAATDRVKVHYHGTLRDGTVFDSSVDRKEPATFPLNMVIPCWTEGVQKIKVGGKAKLTCPAEMAYGDQGRPNIPPGSVLMFEVELISIEAPPTPPPGMTPPGAAPGAPPHGAVPGAPGHGAAPGAPAPAAPKTGAPAAPAAPAKK